MKILNTTKIIVIVTGLVGLSACDQPLKTVYLEQPAFDQETLNTFNAAKPINLDTVLRDKSLLASKQSDENVSPNSFMTSSPYAPKMQLSNEECLDNENCRYAQEVLGKETTLFPAREDVYEWWTTRFLQPTQAEVCGLKFTNTDFTQYELKTFENLAALEATQGYILTHFHSCGSCSTLQDLAVYGSLDLTSMAKTCSKRLTLEKRKSCMQEIGFSEPCSETWAFNGQMTAESCMLECIKEYGLENIILGKEDSPPVDENGNLNQCLQCDEMMSGPGFQYAAGRTRRSSGINSEIARPAEQVYEVPHAYF